MRGESNGRGAGLAMKTFPRVGLRLWLCVTVAALGACGRAEETSANRPESGSSAVATAEVPVAPAESTPSASAGLSPRVPEMRPEPRCRPDMVRVTPPVGSPYCVDRYEATLVDHATAKALSPYYSPVRKWAVAAFDSWSKQRFEVGPPASQQLELPELSRWQRTTEVVPRALSKKGVWPNGHVTGELAEVACKNAGKRLCSPAEWRTACGGEAANRFPYGTAYEAGRCNVFREAHPAAVLHGDASIGHTDPRLNRVTSGGRPLLRKTGDTAACASRWSEDAIYDMVGNLDEWVAHERGSFAGGFYARSTKEGCDWRSTAHAKSYADYSTGVRCCADLP